MTEEAAGSDASPPKRPRHPRKAARRNVLLPRVEKGADGTFHLRELPPLMALSLREMPALLEPDAPGIRDRIAATPYPGDEEGTAHWERNAAPELAHLFQAARDIVETDLIALRPEAKTRGRFRLGIPAAHLNAWLSSLSAARVGLAERHGFGEADLESVLPEDITDDRERALILVHLLGWVQGLLLEAGA